MKIDSEKCTNCGECIKRCPFDAILFADSRYSFNENCIFCGICEEVCPAKAIEHLKINSSIDNSFWQNILVFVQILDGNIHPVTFELLGIANQLAYQTNCSVYAIAIGDGVPLDDLAGYGIKKVFCYDSQEYHFFREDIFVKTFCNCVSTLKPAVVLLGATPEGRTIAPIVAVHFKTGLTADCTALEIDRNSNLLQIRPTYGGNLMAEILTKYVRPQMATVRYHVMPAAIKSGNDMPETEQCSISNSELISSIRQVDIKPIRNSLDISTQRILVVIGNGVAKKEDIPLFDEFAQVIGGKLACSRALVEKGWMSIENQIGLTGKSVSPDLLITCGISGSVQFAAGISGAKSIISINTDKNAAIFRHAHTLVVGDMYDIVPRLTEFFR